MFLRNNRILDNRASNYRYITANWRSCTGIAQWL